MISALEYRPTAKGPYSQGRIQPNILIVAIKRIARFIITYKKEKKTFVFEFGYNGAGKIRRLVKYTLVQIIL